MGAKFVMNSSVPVSYDVLKEEYKAYASPKDKIARLVSGGELIRLKKGLFLPRPQKEENRYPYELIANILRGPSYVSLQTALSYYGMIPERVFAIRSVTTKRSKIYQNQIGRFEYMHAKQDYFSIGIKSVLRDGVSFLIASPEKAICDMIAGTAGLRIQSKKAMREYLEDDMRVDISMSCPADLSVYDSVIETGIKRREIELLKEYHKNAG